MHAKLHKNKYLNNKNVAFKNFINDKKNNEWKVTIIFYAALHYIEGSFPVFYRTESHRERGHNIKVLAESCDTKCAEIYSAIKVPYFRLYNLSRNARYYDIPILDKDVKKAEEYLKTIEENLEFKDE